MLFKKKNKATYDKATQQPTIRSSICTGEKVAGFTDLHTGKFTEVMLIQDSKDLKHFLSMYRISGEDIKEVW